MTLPAVTIISLGGTISSTATGSGGGAPSLSGGDPGEEGRGISKGAEVSAPSLKKVPGPEPNPEDLIELAGEPGRCR